MTLQEAYDVLTYARKGAMSGDVTAVRVCKIMRAECTRLEEQVPLRISEKSFNQIYKKRKRSTMTKIQIPAIKMPAPEGWRDLMKKVQQRADQEREILAREYADVSDRRKGDVIEYMFFSVA